MNKKRTTISDLEEGNIIIPDSKCYFLIRRSSVKIGKNGQKFMDLDLFDGTSSINGKVWEIDRELSDVLRQSNVVHILNGRVTKYQAAIQIAISDARLVLPEDIDSECPGILPEAFYTAEELERMWDDLVAVLTPKHRRLIDKFRSDERLWRLFTAIPGGRSMHHSCRRGLWEHSISVAKTSLVLSNLFNEKYDVDVSLVVLAALLHDVGKIFEFQINQLTCMVEKYSDRGRLLGHVYMGATWIEKLVNSLFPEDNDLKIDLIHIMLSHHGEYEFGSPKRPKTIEALIVATCDNLDASCDAVRTAIGTGLEENWTKPVFMMERPFFKRQNKNNETPDLGRDVDN